MPPKNATDALILCFWKKNRNVLSKPITQAKPAINKICNTKLVYQHFQKHCIWSDLRSPRPTNSYQTVTRHPGTRKTFQNPPNPHQSLQLKINVNTSTTYTYINILCVSLISNIFADFSKCYYRFFTNTTNFHVIRNDLDVIFPRSRRLYLCGAFTVRHFLIRHWKMLAYLNCKFWFCGLKINFCCVREIVG